MSIDGIGKKGGVPVPGASGLNGPAPTGKATGEKFEIGGAARTDAVQSTKAFEEVRAGRMTVDAYLDEKVAHATRGLKGLAGDELSFIQKNLRTQLAADPALADLVRQATGAIPKVTEE